MGTRAEILSAYHIVPLNDFFRIIRGPVIDNDDLQVWIGPGKDEIVSPPQ